MARRLASRKTPKGPHRDHGKRQCLVSNNRQMQISNCRIIFPPRDKTDKTTPRETFVDLARYASLAPDSAAILTTATLDLVRSREMDLTLASAPLSGELFVSDDTAVLTASWLASGSPQTETGRFPQLEPQHSDLPRIIADLGAGEVAARIAAWRAGNRQFDALLHEKVPPAQALRRLALTHWSAGDPRTASVVLATAAALSPYSAPFLVHRRMGDIAVPVMYQTGTRDIGIGSVLLKRGAYEQTKSPKYLLELRGAGHFAWTELNPVFQKTISDYAIAFFDRELRARPTPLLDCPASGQVARYHHS